jgi:hypothetical protein
LNPAGAGTIVSESKVEPHSSRPQTPAATLRKLGVVILVTGVAIGAAIYLFAPQPDSGETDPALAEYYDKQQLAMERTWGKAGAYVIENLKHVRTYSGIVTVGSIIVSLGCFYLAKDSYDGSRNDRESN